MIFQLETITEFAAESKNLRNYWKNSVYHVCSKSENKIYTSPGAFLLVEIDHCLDINQEYEVPDLWFLHGKTTSNIHSLKIDKKLGSFQNKKNSVYKGILYKVANLKKKKSTLGLESLLFEIGHVLDINQNYETPGFLIFTCRNAHWPPQPQEGQETRKKQCSA